MNTSTMNNTDLPLDFTEERKGKIEKFKDTPLIDRKHGLGIKTKLDFLHLEAANIDNDITIKIENQSYIDEGKVKKFEGSEIENLDLEGMNKIKTNIFKTFRNSFGDWKEKIEYLHEALRKVTLIYIPENQHLDETININVEHKGNTLSHLFLYVGKGTKASLNITSKAQGEGFSTDFTNAYYDTGSDSNVTLLKDIKGKEKYMHSKNLQIVGDDAKLNLTTADFGGKLIINDTVARLEGRASTAYTNNIYFVKEGEDLDLSSTSDHIGRDSYSLLTSKGVCDDSKALIRGLVKINTPAFDANGYQQSDSLLLTENSQVVSIPDLVIHNDQVKCSHGSTVSNLEEDKVFYLMSRGISKREAEKKLIEGFYYPILEKISEKQREPLTKIIESRLQD